MKKLLHITAEHPQKGGRVDLYFYSVKQARYFNSGLKNFRVVEVYHGE